MSSRQVLHTGTTPQGETIELAIESGFYVVRIAGVPLMSSDMHNSEEAMATLAAERIGPLARAKVLIGGLGMGFTLRAALDSFGNDAKITVAELLPEVVRYNQDELGHLADHPLRDRRVQLVQADVTQVVHAGRWDAILLDVDNGPEAFTVPSNGPLYSRVGVKRLASALTARGVLVVWSAFPSPRFERDVRALGLAVTAKWVRGRASGKGPRHTLFFVEARGRSA